MERCFTARELVITTSRVQWNAAYYHCDVILIVTSFATELATPSVTDVRTYVRTEYGHLTAFNTINDLQYKSSVN